MTEGKAQKGEDIAPLNKLKSIRGEICMTQEELAEAIGVSVRTIKAQESKVEPAIVYVNAAKYIAIMDSLRALKIVFDRQHIYLSAKLLSDVIKESGEL